MYDNEDTLASWIRDARNTVVFTGAGMSTESGLRDFRSKGGLWRDEEVASLATVDALYHKKEAFVSFYRWRIEQVLKYEPHMGHRLLAQWEQQGLIKTVITQNVDDYHERAQSRCVLHLHGTIGTVHCQQCGQKKPSKTFLQDTGILCSHCNGDMRPSVVLFGESLPTDVWQRAEKASLEADLLLVLGSSLQVSPANQLPLVAKQSGARFVIVNYEPTPLDSEADLTLHAAVGETLAKINKVLEE